MKFPKISAGDLMHAVGVGIEVLGAVASVSQGGSGSIEVSIHGEVYDVSVSKRAAA